MHTSTFDYKKIILLYGSAKAFINEHDTEDGRHFPFIFGPKMSPPVFQLRLIIK